MEVRKGYARNRLIPVPETPVYSPYRCIQQDMLIIYRSALDGRPHLGRVAFVRHAPGGDLLRCRVERLFARVQPGQCAEEEIRQEQIECIITTASR